MAQIPVERAIFTSARRRHLSGYHLVARSPGVNDQLGQLLSRWSPSHDALLDNDPTSSSLNQFTLGDGLLGLSRSVCGGPEYSGRGGWQTVTISLIYQLSDLAYCGFDTPRLFAQALSNGDLRFDPFDYQCNQIHYPRILQAATNTRQAPSGWPAFLADVHATLRQGIPCCVVGIAADQSLAFLEQLLQLMTPESRSQFSFSTGLKPSRQRPFQLHLCPKLNYELNADFRRLDYKLLTFNPPVTESTKPASHPEKVF